MYLSLLNVFILLGGATAVCPYMDGGASLVRRDGSGADQSTGQFLAQFELNDTDVYMTSDVGGPIGDQISLKAGPRGPTLLEDFIFRQKIQHFDHERVPERAVHARGAGAHGKFVSYADWSNFTAASFLGGAGKETPVFVRFSTVAGSRGSSDTARDVHGFATRFYTDEGNFDIVGNNIPVFFIQDAIQFPDLVHAVKPSPDKEIPQAATAHDTAWDFFSQQPSALHTLFWAMAGNGLPRSFRHMDGFGVHTYRLVTDDGKSKLVKWHWKSVQGKASLVWEEAQVLAGKNADFHRQDLWDSIASGNGPKWELGVQIMDEADALKYGFDLLDPTKFVPEELVPVTKLGIMHLDRNPDNYFAETEQVMFQPGHIVRGIDFSEDPLLQGRIFSYLDTQLNRHGGPNFEQLPINRPRVPIHNNNRDGAGQNFIPLNTAAYSPNTLNNGSPKQATQNEGKGFFTTPGRTVTGSLNRELSPTFDDVWSQPRLFYNSLIPVEQQFLINAMRFEISHVQSTTVKKNVLIQLNRVDHDLACRVAEVLNLPVPKADSKYYNNNSTAYVSIFGHPLPSANTLVVGILSNSSSPYSMSQAAALKTALTAGGTVPVMVSQVLLPATDINYSPTDITYSAADATGFDALIITGDTASLFDPPTPYSPSSTFFPANRPRQIVQDAYDWGKPVAALADGSESFRVAQIPKGPGVYYSSSDDAAALQAIVDQITAGLRTFRFVNRFAVDGAPK